MRAVFEWLSECEKVFGFDLEWLRKNKNLWILSREISSILV